MSASVIWITGYSSSGKTTVGRSLQAALRDKGVSTVYVDGDELRSIFANRWGYERQERVDLARVYFRLCSYLSSQGLTVIIAAVAMYDEVRSWIKENVPNSLEIYLEVPEDERRRRDGATKQLYAAIGNASNLYDEPKSPDLVIQNHGGMSPKDAASRILELVEAHQTSGQADFGRTRHWSSYYRGASAPPDPSPFARAMATSFPKGARIVEIGCGNGRDSAFFASEGHETIGIDLSAEAIRACESRYGGGNPRFIAGDIVSAALPPASADVLYSRFNLHAMPEPEEEAVIAAGHDLLRPGGRLFIECRSINDPLARKGEVISKTERIHGHYRRFIVADELVDRVTRHGFRIDRLEEGKGFATFGDEDPVVIRLSATRP